MYVGPATEAMKTGLGWEVGGVVVVVVSSVER